MKRVWRYYPGEECELCGSSVEIYTDDDLEPGYGYEDDPMRCAVCGTQGYLVVVEEDEVYIHWGWEDLN